MIFATSLAPRLRAVLGHLMAGLSEKQIAIRLGLSRHTVHAYVKSLHKEFGASSRGELLSICYRMLMSEMERASVPPAEIRINPAVRVKTVYRSVPAGRSHEAVYAPGC